MGPLDDDQNLLPGFNNKESFLTLPTNQLLEKFGAGTHKPGSGSAAALNGLLACKMLITVISLTKKQENYRGKFTELDFYNKELTEKIEPILVRLFNEDSIAFDAVIQLRNIRDSIDLNSPERRKVREAALEKLKVATEIPIVIARTCIELGRYALAVFDIGYKSARGDSGVAVSSTLSGAYGSLFVIYLNLTDFRESEWAQNKRAECEALFVQIMNLQNELFSRVVKLQVESEPSAQLDFDI